MDEALGQSSHTTKQKKNYAPRPNIHDNISSSESSDAIPDIIELKIPTNRPFKKQGGVDKAARDDEDRKELENLMRGWKSAVYAFYEPIPLIEYVKGRKAHTFVCTRTGCNYRCRRYLDSESGRASTGNLRRHALSCWKEEVFNRAVKCGNANEARKKVLEPFNVSGTIPASFESKEKGIAAYMARNDLKAEIRAQIVRWVSKAALPFDTVEGRGFMALMKALRPEPFIPSASTVELDVKSAFVRTRERIVKLLKEYKGRLNFATDTWTSPSHHTYMAVTVHLEFNGDTVALVLDIIEVPESRVKLAIAFQKILKDFGIEHKILSVTCDDASNNDTMINEMHERIPAYNKVNRARCFLHVLNLVARSLLKQLGLPENEAEDLTIEEKHALRNILELAKGIQNKGDTIQIDWEDEDSEGDETYDEYLVDQVNEVEPALTLTPEEELELKESMAPITRTLVKLRKLAFITTDLLVVWKALLKRLGLRIQIMPQDVKTCWNSTYDMLQFALKHRKALKEFTSDLSNELQRFELDEIEWEITEELANVLKYLKDGTLFFSRDSPNLQTVIPAMDKIDKYFTNRLEDPSLNVAIRALIVSAKAMLDKYYGYADHPEIYRIATVLHPRYKLRYFKQAGRDDKWIRTSRELVRDELNRSCSDVLVKVEEDEARLDNDLDVEIVDRPKGKATAKGNIFDKGDDSASDTSEESALAPDEELELYLSTRPDKDVADPIRWWKEKQTVYPRLSQMAIDFLTIPGTTVDVKRMFGRASIIHSQPRRLFTVVSPRAFLCVGSWGMLIRAEDLDEVE